jgi:hypothetical protein
MVGDVQGCILSPFQINETFLITVIGIVHFEHLLLGNPFVCKYCVKDHPAAIPVHEEYEARLTHGEARSKPPKRLVLISMVSIAVVGLDAH